MTGQGGAILYQSETLQVRARSGAGGNVQVVSFDPWHVEPGFDRPGFGEDFFARAGIAAIHVLTRANDWYQYDDLDAACAVVREAVSGARRVVAYGCSMGGYAAVRLADRVGAHAVLAVSPQYSVDPARMPDERRWLQVQRRIAFRDDLDGPACSAIVPVIVHDPRDADGGHAARYRADMAIAEIRTPYAGHPASTYLQSVGLLQPLVRAVIDDTLDPAAFERRLWAARRTSPLYGSLLAAAQPAWRPRTAAGLARIATETSPGDFTFQYLAERLRALGDLDGAIAAHERALGYNRDVVLLWEAAKTLVLAGRIEEALALGDEAEGKFADSIDLARFLARLRERAGRWRAAAVTLERLIRLEGPRPVYRLRLWRARVMGMWGGRGSGRERHAALRRLS